MKKYLLLATLSAFLTGSFSACTKKNDDYSRYHLLPGEWRLTHMGPDANMNGAPDEDELLPFEELIPLEGSIQLPVDITFRKDLSGTARVKFDSYSFNADFKWGLTNDEQTLFIARGADTTLYNIHSFEASKITVFDANLPGGMWEVFQRN